MDEFRDMVKALHRAGIEVIFDVVYNHTAEDSHDGPTISLRGIDNPAYYLLDPQNQAEYINDSGVGNTLKGNHTIVRDQILQYVKEADLPPKAVLLDLAVQDDLDITSSEMLKSLITLLHNQGIDFYFAEIHAPVLKFSTKTGLLDLFGEDHVFPTVDAAVRAIESNHE